MKLQPSHFMTTAWFALKTRPHYSRMQNRKHTICFSNMQTKFLSSTLGSLNRSKKFNSLWPDMKECNKTQGCHR